MYLLLGLFTAGLPTLALRTIKYIILNFITTQWILHLGQFKSKSSQNTEQVYKCTVVLRRAISEVSVREDLLYVRIHVHNVGSRVSVDVVGSSRLNVSVTAWRWYMSQFIWKFSCLCSPLHIFTSCKTWKRVKWMIDAKLPVRVHSK